MEGTQEFGGAGGGHPGVRYSPAPHRGLRGAWGVSPVFSSPSPCSAASEDEEEDEDDDDGGGGHPDIWVTWEVGGSHSPCAWCWERRWAPAPRGASISGEGDSGGEGEAPRHLGVPPPPRDPGFGGQGLLTTVTFRVP